MDTTKWEWFYYSDLFYIKKGKRLTKADMIDGDVPYIGATDNNNGITAYIANDTYLHPANTITVSYNGSIAEAYYQTSKYWATDDVNVLYPKFKLNKYIAIFLNTLINKEKYRFNYGRKWDKESMQKSRIKLPIKTPHNPNWEWIENYVKTHLFSALTNKAKQVWNNSFIKKPICDTPIKLNEREWKSFKISEFCNIPYKAKAYNAIELKFCVENNTYTIPYITRTDVNNGCKSFVVKSDDIIDIEKANAITIGDTTATIYYQEKDFICGDHMVVLRSMHFNKYVGLFIVTLLNKERFRYNYGRAFNKDIIANTELKLPVVPNTDIPDWQFMEDYIKSLPYSANL